MVVGGGKGVLYVGVGDLQCGCVREGTCGCLRARGRDRRPDQTRRDRIDPRPCLLLICDLGLAWSCVDWGKVGKSRLVRVVCACWMDGCTRMVLTD